jgi:hypothetical protein
VTVNSFDAWMAHLFDESRDDGSPDEQPSVWLDRYARQDTPAATADRVRQLFGDAGVLLRHYSDDQAARGLREIVDDGSLWALRDPKVPVVARTRGLRSIVTLYAEVFAPRVTVEHPKRTPKLEQLCFMFFEIAPLDLGEDTVLDVLEETSALPSVPCQRAALHGLGHAHHHSPEHVPPIVDRWLSRHRDAPQELRDYALAARTGAVM